MAEFGIEVSLVEDDYPTDQWAKHGVLAVLEQIASGEAHVDINFAHHVEVKRWQINERTKAELRSTIQNAIALIEEENQ